MAKPKKREDKREQNIIDENPFAAAFRKSGWANEEQLESARHDNASREQARAQQNQRKNMTLSQRGKAGKSGKFIPTPSVAGKIYGQIKNISAATVPADIATAPYNFIPLPEKALSSELGEKIGNILIEDNHWKEKLSKEEQSALRDLFHDFRFSGDRYSGEIELNIKALTSLFIGGNESGETFAPAGSPMIPGSSLRGMVKNLFQIITCGAWEKGETLTGNHPYYRCLIASNRAPQNKILNELYKDRMTSTEDGKVKKVAKPGFLVKIGTKYRIYPIIEDKEHSIVIKEYKEKYRADISKSLVRWDGERAYVQVGLISAKSRNNLKSKDEIEQFMRVTPAEKRKDIGKQYYRYMNVNELNKAKYFEVPDDVIEEYKNDKNRGGVNLLDGSSKKYIEGNMPQSIAGFSESYKYIVPCYYLLENGVVTSFGHGQSFRVAYRNSIMDAISSELTKPVVDFASAVFGRSLSAASWASRVAFDDAKLISTHRNDEKAKARALMNPNPTSIQLYLNQDSKESLLHWESSNARIRGYKMYWHNPKTTWKASPQEIEQIDGKRDEQKGGILKNIQPLAKDSEFKGAIRFKELTACELGALLKVFHVCPEGQPAYKIGMGKSIGLGSIEIKTKLQLENGSRYTQLLDNDFLHNSLTEESNPDKFIRVYEEYVSQQSMNAVYKKTIKTLGLMLDYRNTELPYWADAVAPIDGSTNNQNQDNVDKRFELRSILPDVEKVIERAEKPM